MPFISDTTLMERVLISPNGSKVYFHNWAQVKEYCWQYLGMNLQAMQIPTGGKFDLSNGYYILTSPTLSEKRGALFFDDVKKT